MFTFLCGMELRNLLYSSEAVMGSGPLRLIATKRSDVCKTQPKVATKLASSNTHNAPYFVVYPRDRPFEKYAGQLV